MSSARTAGRFFLGVIVSAGTIGVSAHAAGAATTASFFGSGVLTVTGDAHSIAITISRNAAGGLLVNGGAVQVRGGTPTVANTRMILVVGQGGNDVLTLDEANGALPPSTQIGGAGNDVLTGGSAADILIGQAGNDTLLGKGGNDMLLGGIDNDSLTGGAADDQALGDDGNDRLIWNPGDATDLNEGGAGTDTTEVNGGNGSEVFTATANGSRVRFDRTIPAPFAIDMGAVENLTLNANGGNDAFSATGNLAVLVSTTVDGGDGDDTITGTNGVDRLLGGAGGDYVDGQQGNDAAQLGAGDDTFQWDPGDGSDLVEGQDGTDDLVFNGSNVAEKLDVAPNGARVRLTRDVGSVTMDLGGIESTLVRALGGVDAVTLADLSGTELTQVTTDLAAADGTDDKAQDDVTVRGTAGDDVAVLAGAGATLNIDGLPTTVSVTGAAPSDVVTVAAGDGADVVEASGVSAASPRLVLDGGAGDDVLIGGAGADTLLGRDGDDVLIGGPGVDVLDGGPGANTLIEGEALANGTVAGPEWLAKHERTVDGHRVLDHAGHRYPLPS
jgi:Ca2+-binding RTX toxin-like protein